ncbi:hypothetical protein [Clostridium sp.]|uniref:hypothetical protein n=1 Tax=Clostridium sp. TaxID=1506 RepID=UPI0026DD8C55|nr:hypothetical protein [Clostridium sp.]MDO5040029.1 hypothetical protein [Clostridium sp.]
MNRVLKKRSIFILIIASIIATISIFNIYLNSEERNWKEIDDKKLEERVENFIENFFMLENIDIDIDKLNEVFSSTRFLNMDDGRLIYIYETKFLLNLRGNLEKENIKFNIELQKIYKDDSNRLKVLVNYDRSFNFIGNNEVNKEHTTYEVILLREQNSFLIDKIYEVDALNKDSFLEVFYSKEKLYEKYIEDEFLKYKKLSRKFL